MTEAPGPVPDQSMETLQQLPVRVVWTGEGSEGSFLGGFRKVFGEFFSMDLQGQSYDELSQHDENLVPPATFSGSIEYEGEGANKVKYLQAGTLLVGEDFRRNHLGERLSQAMACIAVEHGCKGIKLSFSHPAALKIFRNIFGDERMHFTKKDEDNHRVEVPWDITPDEANEAIIEERRRVVEHGVQHGTSSGIWRHHPETDEKVLPGAVDGVSAWIDVEGLDTSGFEQPVEIAKDLVLYDVPIVEVSPELADPEQAEKEFKFSLSGDAEILLLDLSGTNGEIPESVLALSQQTSEQGVPVFVVEKAFTLDDEDNREFTTINPEARERALASGVNIVNGEHQLSEVGQVAQLAVNIGHDIAGVKQAVLSKFEVSSANEGDTPK